MTNFSNRVAIVTGGSFGIGRATALKLAELGAKVYVADLAERPENEPAFAKLGITTLPCDVRVGEQITTAFDAVWNLHGRLDTLVCSAGIQLIKPIPDVTEDEWDNVVDTNVKGVFLACQKAIQGMRATGGGSIVILSSNAGLLPRTADPIYSFSKGALVYLMKTIALCHSKDRIRCNAVCPGPVADSGMVLADLAAAFDPNVARRKLIAASPLAQAYGRMNTLEEIADAVVYLASDAAQMLTGCALTIDGGKSLGVPPT